MKKYINGGLVTYFTLSRRLLGDIHVYMPLTVSRNLLVVMEHKHSLEHL